MSPKMGENLNLALALEGAIEPATPEIKALVGIANALAQLPEPEIDAAFADELERLLLTDGVTQPVGRPQLTIVKPAAPVAPEPVRPDTVVRMPSRRFTVRRSLTAAVAAASLAAFPLVAAASSLPSSPFYGLKQLEHRIELSLANGPVAKGFIQMRFAGQYVSEAEQLAAFPHPDESVIAKTLANGAAALRDGSALVLGNTSDPTTLTRLADMAAATERDLNGFAGGLGGRAAVHAAQQVYDASQGIQQAVANVLGFTTTASVQAAPASPSTQQAPATATADKAPATSKSSDSSRSSADPSQARKGLQQAADESCRTIGEAQLGDALRAESLAACDAARSASRF